MSSPYDNYNWTLLELMSSGKPVIATAVGGTSEILRDGHSALLAEATAESIASGIRRLIDDPKLRQKLAGNALNTVKEKHSLTNLIKYERLLHEI